MMNEVISKHFAEFVIFRLENRIRYKEEDTFVTEGILNGIKVVIVEHGDNWSGKIETSKDVYVSLLLEYLEHIDG